MGIIQSVLSSGSFHRGKEMFSRRHCEYTKWSQPSRTFKLLIVKRAVAVGLVSLSGAVPVAVLRLQDLRQPVLELHDRVAAQLAEHGGAFDRLVGRPVELAENGRAIDLRHGERPFRVGLALQAA